jgi:hypothetical protein
MLGDFLSNFNLPGARASAFTFQSSGNYQGFEEFFTAKSKKSNKEREKGEVP